MTIHELREPCKNCGWTKGTIVKTNGQNIVKCGSCDAYAYCAPKSETGEPVAHVRTRPNIKPSTKARILDRDGHTCVSCHADDQPLHIGHLLSVDDGRKLGATDHELFADDNLGSFCSECNLGFGKATVSLRLVYRILQARVRRRDAVDAERGEAS